MAVVNRNGHGVTTSLPSNSDAVTVGSLNVPYPQAPAQQSGGSGGPQITKDAATSSPPKGTKSTPNSSGKGKQTSSKLGVYNK